MVVESTAEIHPELRLGKERPVGLFRAEELLVAPEIGEALECQTFQSKKIIDSPNGGGQMNCSYIAYKDSVLEKSAEWKKYFAPKQYVP